MVKNKYGIMMFKRWVNYRQIGGNLSYVDYVYLNGGYIEK